MRLGEGFLLQAIRNESASRDVYNALSKRVDGEGRAVLERMATEEDTHHIILGERYRTIYGKEPVIDVDQEAPDSGSADDEQTPANLPDFSFIEKSIFTYTDAIEALRLCLGAEIDAIYMYTKQMAEARTRTDMRILKSLVRFEKRHRRLLEKLIRQTQRRE